MALTLMAVTAMTVFSIYIASVLQYHGVVAAAHQLGTLAVAGLQIAVIAAAGILIVSFLLS